MKAVLCAEIDVQKMAFFAEMAWLERRPELGLICRAAKKSGNRMTAALVQGLLPGMGEAGARNVIAWCAMLGLCDGQGALKGLGEDVAERDEAPVPEQGVFGCWVAEHPLMGRRILAAERLSSRSEPRVEAISGMKLIPDKNKVFRSVLQPKERFILREILSNHSGEPGVVPEESQARLRLEWTLRFEDRVEQWQLRGVLEGKGSEKMLIQHEPERGEVDLGGLADYWGEGVLSGKGRWKRDERRLLVALAGLSEQERESFRKSYKVPRLDVPGKGEYANVVIEDVPIGPVSSEEAQRWAMIRLERALVEKPVYRSRGQVKQLFYGLVDKTPLQQHAPVLPSHGDLLRSQLENKRLEVFWSLAAPVDLAPSPLSAEELGAFGHGSVGG